MVVLVVAFFLIVSVVALPLLLLLTRKPPPGPPKPPPGPPKTKQNEKQNKTTRKTPFRPGPAEGNNLIVDLKGLSVSQVPISALGEVYNVLHLVPVHSDNCLMTF